MLLHDTLRQAAGTHASSAAVISGGESMTYAQLDTRSDAVAVLLRAQGVGRGDRVATLIENSLDAVVALWGILKAGAVLVPLGPTIRPTRLAAIFRDCTPRAAIAAPQLAQSIAQAAIASGASPTLLWTTPPQGLHNDPSLAAAITAPSADALRHLPRQIDKDLAAIIYTSGTTGEPKGVMLTHRNFCNTVGVISRYLDNTPDDVVCCTLPHWFSYGLCQLLAAARTAHTILLERSFAFPYDVLRTAAQHRVTGLPGVPSLFAALLKLLPITDLDLSSLRYFTNAAAAIPPAHILRLCEAFPAVRFHSMYGQTECTRALTLDPSLASHSPESVGLAIENSDASLVDDQGLPLPLGSTGQLVIRGANVSLGYWNKPAQTASKFHDGPVPGEKVLHTGDLFRTDSKGLFYFVSRNDDVFKCRGEKVAPQAIENAICELPEVAEAAVIGVEDKADGLAVKAFVVPRAGSTLTEARVRQHCNSRLEPVMVPRFVELCQDLPRTESGKIRRATLREQAAPQP